MSIVKKVNNVYTSPSHYTNTTWRENNIVQNAYIKLDIARPNIRDNAPRVSPHLNRDLLALDPVKYLGNPLVYRADIIGGLYIVSTRTRSKLSKNYDNTMTPQPNLTLGRIEKLSSQPYIQGRSQGVVQAHFHPVNTEVSV